MFNKHFRFLLTNTVVLVLVFSMLPGESTQAQGSQSFSSRTYLQLPDNPDLGIQNEVQATVAIGEPGLSYRYVKTFGKTEVPYLADTSHLNYPYGLGSDGNNVWITELWGNRALKYSKGGSFQQQIGIAGVPDINGTTLGSISDIAVDAEGNVWIVDDTSAHVAKFDSAGNFVSELGTLWESGMDNSHFATPMSIAFDADGNIYVSDGSPWWTQDNGNHRIQVFDSTGSYLTTIGETGVAGSDNSHLHGPRHIVIYDNQLFIADGGNHRIQIFNITNPASPAYVATIGVSGEAGGDNAHFGNPSGVAVDADYIYVADTWNNRVQVFNRITRAYVATIGTGWGTGNYQFKLPSDVAVDSTGNLYVADFVNTRVQQFSHSGTTWTYTRRYGVTNVPYLTDGYHYNRPSGVAVAGDGSIYITEDNGHRLVKLSATGVPLWTKGVAGVKGDWYDSNTYLDNPADVALDASGHVYVADRWYGRVKIFNPNGSFYNEIDNLNCPGGVFVALDGRIYVADSCDQTVRIYSSYLSLVGTLGTPGEAGSDNTHFNWPEDVAVDSNGFIFVSDQWNHRIQVFNNNQAYVRTMGVTGEGGENFDHFWSPNGLSIDGLDRLYVADQDNNRIQVFDASGAYLTTIAGSWGTNTSQLRAPTGVAVDTTGNVYVADLAENHRIQKFSPGVPGWEQVNVNGFGNRYNRAVTALEVFNNMLYAGDLNGEEGGSIWRSSDAQAWTQVTEPGFGNTFGNNNPAIIDMVEFNGQLYASAGWGGGAGQLWRSTNGTTWEQVVGDGFGDSDNISIAAMAVYDNILYVGTGNSVTGPQIWRSNSGDISSWNNVVTNGLGCDGCSQVTSLIVFNNSLYAALEGNSPSGMQIWRTSNGSDWSQVGESGFGNADNYQTGGFASFNGKLYIGTRNDVTGGQIWCSSDGSTWTQVIGDGFGNANSSKIESLYTFGSGLYAGVLNGATGVEIWTSANGTTWSQINLDGFGDSNNTGPLWSSSTIVFNSSFYIGTFNWDGNGGEIWKWLLPVVANINTTDDTGDGTLSEGEQVIVPVTELTITFNKEIKTPAVSQFSLKKGTTAIAINSVDYDSLTKTVTLNVNGGKKLPYGKYTLTIKKNISDTDNNAMGENFVRHFSLPKPAGTPILVSPAKGLLTTDYSPHLDWRNVTMPSGTTFDHYKLQVATDDGFSSMVLDQDISGITNSEYTFTADLVPNMRYYWRVQAYNTLGQASAWSAIWNFRTAILSPVLTAPDDAVSLTTRRPLFDWDYVDGATGYKIVISKYTNLSNPITSLSVINSEYLPSADLPANKVLYWRIQAKGPNGPSLWSETRSFTTGNPPSVPVLRSPANGSLVKTYLPTLKWYPSKLPSGTTFKRYELQVDDDSDFSSPVIDFNTTDGDITEVSYTPLSELIPNVKYYWRVRAVNLVGADEHVSGWSKVWNFRTVIIPPVLLLPGDGSTEVTLKPLFDWEDVDGATSYTIQVSISPTFATKLTSTKVTVSNFTPSTNLPKNKLTYWRVRANGPNGPSLWSDTYQFTTPP